MCGKESHEWAQKKSLVAADTQAVPHHLAWSGDHKLGGTRWPSLLLSRPPWELVPLLDRWEERSTSENGLTRIPLSPGHKSFMIFTQECLNQTTGSPH